MNVIHSNLRVLVVGGGVAGLTAATVLRRHGCQVDIVERAPSLRTGGYKVDVRGSAVEVLDRLGLAEAARARRCDVRAGSIVTADGRTVAAMGGDTFGGRTGEDIEIERGDLVELLAEAAGDITLGTSPQRMDQGADEVTVTLDDGRVAAYDVVLGADGVRSAVRRLAAIGDEACERSMGYAIAVTELPDDAGLEQEEVTFVRPCATALVYATATCRSARAMVLFRHDGVLPQQHVERLELLRRVLPEPVWRVPQIHQAFAAAPGFYLDAMTQVELPVWHRGRVGLVGDAAACASPASGQGTTLALLGGYLTATALADRPGDPETAFEEVRSRLAPLVARNQRLGRANVTRMVLPSRRAVSSTLLGLRVLRLLRLEDAVLGTVGRQLDKASQVSLPAPRRDAGVLAR